MYEPVSIKEVSLTRSRHMAKDEMEIITNDKWDEDIWGIEHQELDQKRPIPKLIFYFGENVWSIRHAERTTADQSRTIGLQIIPAML